MELGMKVISFTMEGRFAHFCAPFTNVYRLTQPCPTKTAIIGFIGSVLGVDKDDLSLYDETQCGVEICDGCRTISMPYLTRKGFPGSSANKDFSRTSVEVIANPKYRIYLIGREYEILSKIHQLMSEQESVFTPYLGLAQFIASTNFQVSNIVEGDLIEGVDIGVIGAFIRGFHGELDFDRISKMPKDDKLRLTEFEGIKGIKPPRNFEHEIFTINLDGGIVPLKNTKNVLRISAWDKYVPFF